MQANGQESLKNICCAWPPSTLRLYLPCCRLIDRYVMADVSGANFNPAVSIGLLFGKRISIERFILYIFAQVQHVRAHQHFGVP